MQNPGKKATEFWLIVVFGVMMIANGSDAINVPWEQIQWYGGIVAAYALGRSYVKGQAVKTPA